MGTHLYVQHVRALKIEFTKLGKVEYGGGLESRAHFLRGKEMIPQQPI